jgi:protein-disulfide isomerase
MPEKKSTYFSFQVPKFTLPSSINPYLVLTLLVCVFLLGMLTNKVMYLEKNLKDKSDSITANAGTDATAQAPQAIPTEDLSPKQVSVDDDPVLGDKNAKVTIIDFLDYECPFCKRYFDQTYEQIKKNYVDTGKVKYVVRDLPLSFHQNAHKEAEAAECAREQGGDSVYFQYHDEIFKRTTSNGTGLTLSELPVIASDLGLNSTALQSCLDSGKYKEEVDKDLAAAATVGASGTPTFFVGKSSANSIITGTKIVGAQPYSAFQTEIDKLLK